MKIQRKFSLRALVAALAAAAFSGPSGRAAQFGRVDLGDPKVNEAFDTIEKSIGEFTTKAKGEFETLGKTSKETTDALDKLGKAQHELATRLAEVEQKGVGVKKDEPPADLSWGAQVTKAEPFKAWAGGQVPKMRVSVDTPDVMKEIAVRKNTVLTSGANLQADRLPNMVQGPWRDLTIEGLLNSRTTDTGLIEFTRELLFTNNAAEVAEGAAKPESSITFELAQMPVTTIAHWIKISRQLSMDAPALAAYINSRMRYGVNKRAEDQIVSGNGTAPNISGLLKSGNFTPHAYTAASLTALGVSTTIGNRMIELMMYAQADAGISDYPVDFFIMNPADFVKVALSKDGQGQYLLGGPAAVGNKRLWDMPIYTTNAIPADTFLALNRNAATVVNREGVVVEMSESDSDNFTKNLITIRAERRLALVVEIPAAIRGGDLTPA